jgi:hypothetical protein
MNAKQPVQISIQLKADLLPRFSMLFGTGIRLRVRVGESIKALLCDQLGISKTYVQQRIQTIFHNGKIVDDVDAAVVKNGSTLALSAAMPGLVGATLRKKGVYGPMRRQISYVEDHAEVQQTQGIIVLKLFNLLVAELGEGILRRGVFLDATAYRDFISRQAADFFSGIAAAEMDGTACAPSSLAHVKEDIDEVRLQVDFQ